MRVDGDAVVRLGFHGTRIALIAVVSGGLGVVLVELDDDPPIFIDLNGPLSTSSRVWTSRVLSPGLHELDIYWTGISNSPGGGTTVTFDAVDIVGTLAGM